MMIFQYCNPLMFFS